MADTAGLLARSDLGALFAALTARGYAIIAPTVRDGAVVAAPITTPDDLPAGVADRSEPGRYRLTGSGRADGALFAHTVPANGWKRFLHPPEVRLWAARATADGNDGDENGGGFTITAGPPEAPRQALFGVRACDLVAIAAQDRVLAGEGFTDPIYAARRANAFLVAVNCGVAGPTCFCASLAGSGPAVRAAHDLALTEFPEPGNHRFLLEAGSPAGAAVLADLPLAPATAADFAARDALTAATAAAQQRSLPPDVGPRLADRLDHPHWQTIGARCLSCGACTMACPTCFCSTVEDTTSLDGQTAERHRAWDSCFTLEFSYIHGGSVRQSTASRYRQWLTHKLSTWHRQFGTEGCVGCGRCITWCPVGIDITAEAAALVADTSA